MLTHRFRKKSYTNPKILTGLLTLLQKSLWIGEHLSRQDSDGLLSNSRERLQQVRDVIGITHLYFNNVNRINILRVHNPEQSGDVIKRFTTVEAERTGKVFSGLELGSFGTLTLRVVAPWEYKQKRIGYVELGIDASLILDEIAEQGDTGLILAISKSGLNKQKWQEHQRLIGRNPNWDRYSDSIISSKHGLSNNQQLNIPDWRNIYNPSDNIGFIQEIDNDIFVWRQIDIKDVRGLSLGTVYLSINVTDWIRDYQQTGILTFIIYLIISIILIFTLYILTQRTQKAETELKLTKDKFEKLASYDQLVGLPNRHLFKNELRNRIEEAKRFNQIIAVSFIDLDNFKIINDTLGHDQGDMLIQKASKRISQLIRQYDVLARFGGDEFILMMPNIDSQSDLMNIMDKILKEMAKPIKLNSEIVHITISIGISLFPDDARNVDDLLRYADVAMYEAKEAGRNNYRFFTSQNNDLLLRKQMLENLLREAIKNNNFELYYQPLINLTTNKISSYEALIRWFPSIDSPPATEEFINIAESSSLIIDIGNWVIEEACRQSSLWKLEKHSCTKININISGRQLLHLDIYELILKNLKKYNLAFTDIGIELTENVLLQANETLINNLQKLIDEGMEISMDDFGTGYSSLSYLKKFPLSTVKIDREFVLNCHDNQEDKVLIKTIIAMGHSLGLKVVAEGVEKKEHYDLVREAGCDYAQGYYIQKPVAAEEL